MSLKVELKPGERLIIGTALVRNGEQRARLFIEGDAPILREKDILTPATADTPAKKIYLVRAAHVSPAGPERARRRLLPAWCRISCSPLRALCPSSPRSITAS